MRDGIETETKEKSDANFVRHPERNRGIPMRKL